MKLRTVSESIQDSIIKTTKKLAKDLKVGDVTTVGETVVVAPSAGIKTPSGKIDLVVQYPNGKRVSKTWNKNTEIAIRVKEETNESAAVYDDYAKSQKSKFKYNTKPSDYPETVIHKNPRREVVMKAKVFDTKIEADKWMKKHPNHRIVQGSGGKGGKTWVSRIGYDAFKVNIDESLEPQKVNGIFYRVDSGFIHPRGATAKDVLDFEADELDNEDGKQGRENMKKAGIDLSKYPAKSIVWVTRDKKSAKRYKEEYGGQIEEVEIKNGIVVVEDDGDGGTLILKK